MADEMKDSPLPGPEEGSVDSPARPPRQRRRRLLRALAFSTVLVVALAVGTGLWLYRHLDGNIRTDSATEKALATRTGERPRPAPGNAQNILIMGSDYRPELGSARSDTVMLVHLSGDGQKVQVVGVPRDLMVPIPACERPDGGVSRAQYAQFNWSFAFGGAACTIRTIEELTGIRVDHHIVVGFDSFTKIVDTIGGVQVDLPQAERDPNVGLDLTAGPHVLDGTQALAYVRAREYVGDGSDINRMARQQRFLGLLSAKLRSAGVLFDPVRLYRVMDAATSGITADSGLDTLDKLYQLVERVRNIPQGQVDFRTVPQRPYPADPNRVVPVEPAADQLFAALRADVLDAPAAGGRMPRS